MSEFSERPDAKRGTRHDDSIHAGPIDGGARHRLAGRTYWDYCESGSICRRARAFPGRLGTLIESYRFRPDQRGVARN